MNQEIIQKTAAASETGSFTCAGYFRRAIWDQMSEGFFFEIKCSGMKKAGNRQ